MTPLFFLPLLVLLQGSTAFCPSPKKKNVGVDQSSRLYLQTTDSNRLFSPKVYDTILSGRIAVIPDFLKPEQVLALRTDAQDIHNANQFSTDALSSYGSSGKKFDPSKDRAVLRLNQWKDISIGTWDSRRRFGQQMADIRADLAHNLNRPHLNQGQATSSTKYGNGSTEISYTRFGPGAFLKRHVDEHHEELKGRAGWSQPTRRSVSWLIYLNDSDWNSRLDGGQLRTFARTDPPGHQAVGARPNGDLQIGWLRATRNDPMERPVFLDGRQEDAGKCAMYKVRQEGNDDSSIEYITPTFDANPILYMAGGESLVKRALLKDRRDLAERFRFIEAPKSVVGELLTGGNSYAGTGLDADSDEVIDDVDPIGGTLVLFDSVSLPHEVLATRARERWAASGWFHEDQQPIEGIRNG